MKDTGIREDIQELPYALKINNIRETLLAYTCFYAEGIFGMQSIYQDDTSNNKLAL